MSLIRVRRRRKREWLDAKKGKTPGALLALLVVVIATIWYLGRIF